MSAFMGTTVVQADGRLFLSDFLFVLLVFLRTFCAFHLASSSNSSNSFIYMEIFEEGALQLARNLSLIRQ